MEFNEKSKLWSKFILVIVLVVFCVFVFFVLKENVIRKRWICVYLKCIFVVIGMIFMVLEGEFFILKIIEKNILLLDVLKILIIIFIVILIVFIIV